MKYHLNMKTKQCPHCPMVFVETKNLTRHLKTHVIRTSPFISFTINSNSNSNLYNIPIFCRHWKSHTRVKSVAGGSLTVTMFGHTSRPTPIETFTGNSNAQ